MTDIAVRRAATVAVLLLLPSLALAQDDRWFRVELLVFSQGGGAQLERWEAIPKLAYPDRYRFLLHDSGSGQRGDAAVTIDEFGRQVVTPRSTAAAPTTTPDSPPPEEEEARDLFQAAAFRTLPAGERSLRGKAAYMERSGRYRVLFHEAWLQPVPAEGRAVPLILDRSGDTGQWPALQGWIKLHLARYLHLETNLWLNTSGDYLPGNWRMPAPPLAPPSVIVVEPPEPHRVNTGVIDPEAGYALVEEQAPEELAQTAGPAYPFRHAVLLQQKRRMRSGEIYYLDHPMMGAIVRLSPVGSSTLDEQAALDEPAALGGDALPPL